MTETMLFGTTKRLKSAGEINVLHNNQRINFTEINFTEILKI